MKKIRLKYQLILGVLIAALLPACASQKKVKGEVKEDVQEETVEPRPELQERPMRVLYGVPPEVYKMREERARQEADSLKNVQPNEE